MVYAVSMKTLIALITLLLFTITSQAEIYKGTDADGNVIYSDEELPNATEIKVPKGTSVPMPKPGAKKVVEKEEEEITSYNILKITGPANNNTISDSSGNVPVTLFITPKLDVKHGHHISIFIDGAISIKKTTQLKLQIPNVSRGSHSLQAKIRDAKSKTLKSSNTISFHMKRHSIQHKKTGASSWPLKPDGTPYTPGPQNVNFKPGPVLPVPISIPAS
jgi:hypothetical protein